MQKYDWLLSEYVLQEEFLRMSTIRYQFTSVVPINDTTDDSNCNCRNSSTCPMDGKCNDQNMIYQAEVTTPSSRETYIGLCDTTFKLRYRNHVCSFKNERYKHATELSKYIWSLKDKGIPYNIKWRKVKQARSYSSISKRCNLCLWEKYFIICKPEMSLLRYFRLLTEETVGSFPFTFIGEFLFGK